MTANLYKIMKYQLFILVFFIALVSCKKTDYQVKTIKAELIEVNDKLPTDSSVVKLFEPYKKQLEEKVNKIIAYTPVTLTRKDGTLQSTLGNIYADICKENANPLFKKSSGKDIDMAFFNFGGVRQSIPKGNVTVADIFKLMPFENKLVVVEMNGKRTREMFKYFEEKNLAHPFSGAQIIFKGKKIKTIKINDKVFNPEKNYYVLTSDYLQHGGDHMDFFKDPVKLYPLEYKVRDAILDFFKEKDTVRVKLDQRIIIE
jgi:5'-nucleotidase